MAHPSCFLQNTRGRSAQCGDFAGGDGGVCGCDSAQQNRHGGCLHVLALEPHIQCRPYCLNGQDWCMLLAILSQWAGLVHAFGHTVSMGKIGACFWPSAAVIR
eukprot:1154244-Pelagomonas_calceolata.AAC.3